MAQRRALQAELEEVRGQEARLTRAVKEWTIEAAQFVPGEAPDLAAAAEVAELLKLNQQTVRNWIDQGSLPAIRMGRRVRIKRSDFERVLEQNYSPGTAVPSEPAGPSAEDFWGGTPVGLAEPDPGSETSSEPNAP